MDFDNKTKEIERYQKNLIRYCELKGFIRDARIVDRYEAIGEKFDFVKEADKLERKIAKLEQTAKEHKRAAARRMLDSFEKLVKDVGDSLER